MRTFLYLSCYEEKDPLRRVELEQCLEHNFHAGYDGIYLFIEEKDEVYARDLINTHDLYHGLTMVRPAFIIILENRATINDYINKANSFTESDDLHIFSNSDIYITPETLQQIKDYYSQEGKEKVFMALSRWDVLPSNNIKLLDRPDTADFWCWVGKADIPEIKCSCGQPGVDNHIAFKFKQAGYNVVNPSRDIVTRHFHLVKKYNYRQDGKPDGPVIANTICPEPYAFHNPCFLHEI